MTRAGVLDIPGHLKYDIQRGLPDTVSIGYAQMQEQQEQVKRPPERFETRRLGYE